MKTLAGHNQITGFMKSVGETEAKIAVPEQAAFPTGTINLTADQLLSFSVQGHLSLDPITTPEEISEMRATIKDLFEKRTGENEGAYGELIASTQLSKGANSPQLLN